MERMVAACVVFLGACGGVAAIPDANDGPPDGAVVDANGAPRCDPTGTFGAPEPVDELNTTPTSEDSAFLSPDERTIYFSSTRPGGPGGWDIWFATRPTRDDDFADPTLLAGVNDDAMQRRPVVSGDGLFMYADNYGTDYDIAVSERGSTSESFGGFTVLPALNVGTGDGDPYVLPDHSAVYFVTEGSGDGDIYRAARNGTSFDTPEPVSGVNLGAGDLEASPVLTPDELTMFFQSARAGSVGGYDVWVTTRGSVVAGFSDPVNVAPVNSADIDLPNWVSADGCVLYFTRNVTPGATDYDLYRATRSL